MSEFVSSNEFYPFYRDREFREFFIGGVGNKLREHTKLTGERARPRIAPDLRDPADAPGLSILDLHRMHRDLAEGSRALHALGSCLTTLPAGCTEGRRSRRNRRPRGTTNSRPTRSSTPENGGRES